MDTEMLMTYIKWKRQVSKCYVRMNPFYKQIYKFYIYTRIQSLEGHILKYINTGYLWELGVFK